MAALIFMWILTLIGVNSCGVDSASVRYALDCEIDHQCADGYYCFLPSHTCAKCVECNVYKRTSSWRPCPKVPGDCGQCLPGYEEEILAEGKTRDFCVSAIHASSHTDLIHSPYKNVHSTNSVHYFLVLGLLLFLLPTVFYAFCWKKWTQGHLRRQHSSLPCEEPPPYRSIELTPVSTGSDDSIEESQEDITHVVHITHTKDTVTEATPFRCPDYEEQQNMYNTDEEESETEENVAGRVVAGNLELEDETTMPSDWTPDRAYNNNQLESEHQHAVIENEDQDCQPSNKRRRKEEDPDSSDSNTTQHNINLFINNNIIINKQE